MLATMSASLRPENDAVPSSQVVGSPASVIASDNTRLEIGSESTRTPSQSKITSEIVCFTTFESLVDYRGDRTIYLQSFPWQMMGGGGNI